MAGASKLRWAGVLKTTTFVLLAPALASSASAQTVLGRVLDDTSGNPVEGATVALLAGDGRSVATGITDGEGRFRLDATQPGDFRLSVTHQGHAAYASRELALTRELITDVVVRLGVQAIPIDPLNVVVRRPPPLGGVEGFRARMANPGNSGRFITREEIDRRPVATPSGLVAGQPGVTFRNVGPNRDVILLETRGGQTCLARLFVDGVRVQQAGGQSIDELLDPGTIEGVEVYSAPLSAPIEYQDAIEAPPCGVILFWTRRGERSDPGLGWGWKRIGAGLALLGALLLVGFGGG